MILTELYESSHSCPECGGPAFSDLILAEKQDACYHKVRSRYKVWPSAYASGALVQCRKKGAANWGNKSESVEDPVGEYGQGVSEARRNRTDWEMDAELWFKEIDGKMWQTSIFPNQRAQARAEGWAPSKQEARDMAYIRGLAPKDKPSVTEDFSDVVKGVKRAIKGKPSLQQTLDKHYDKAYAYDRQGGQYDLDAIAKSVRLSDREHQKALRLIDKFMRSPVKNVAEDSSPQVGDAVYYGTRLVGWFKGYSEHGKIITEPNEEEMGDDYSNRDVYWDPQDKITIKPETGVAEDSASQVKRYSGNPEGYTFGRVQQKNYDMLVDILARNGMKFTKIDARTYPGQRSYIDRLSKSTPIMLTTFIVKSPALEWHKYEGFTAGGGQNTVKVGGKKMKLTDFLRLEPKQQDALLKSTPGVAESEKNPHTSALGKALYRDLSKEKKASPAQVQRNKERWDKRQAERQQGVTEGSVDHRKLGKHHEEMTDQELRKVGSKLPDSWDGARFRRKLASHPKYAQALKHYDKSEYHFGKAAKQGVTEGAHWSDEWEPVQDIKTKTGQVVGMVMRHSSGTYAYYDNRKSNIESGFSSADQARQAFVELHNARVRSNNPGVAEGLANANETLRSQIIRLYKKGLEDYDIAYDLDIDEKTVADIIDDYDKKQQQRQSKVAEGYKFKGGFPFDVDHMPGAVHRNADMITDNVKTNDKTHWARAVDSINARVFDDMSEFSTDSHGETVTGNGAVWAKWDNATQTGWFNAEGRPLRTWAVKEQSVEEGFGDIFKKRKNPADGIRVSNGIAYTGDKVNVEGYPKIEGVVSFTHHHNGKIAVMLYPKGHRPMALAVEPSRVSIKQGVEEGIFDRFKKKSSNPTPADPGKYPQRDNVDQWMIDTVEYYKATSPNSVWKLFCPSWADYLPTRVRVGTSSDVMRDHMNTYLKLRAANPEAAQVARQNFDPDHVYPSGPADDYRVNEQSAESIKNQMPVEAWGYRYDRRDQRVAWRKQFSELSAAEKWAALNNATMLGYKTISDMSEGWKGEFAGGTAGSLAGGIAGSSAGASVGPTVGGTIGGLAGGLPGAIAGMAAGAAAGPVVGAAMGGTAGGMVGGRIGDRLGGEPAKEDATTVKEIAPVVVAAGRLAAPWVAKKIADRVRAARATPSTPATNPDVDEPDEHMQEAGSKKSKELVGDRYEPSDFDAMLARVRQLAGAGELKTVWDPTRRTYRNMPTAQQPKDKK